MARNTESRLRNLALATTALAGTLTLSACLGSGSTIAGNNFLNIGDGFREGGGGLPISFYDSDLEYLAMGGLTVIGASTYYNGGSNTNGYTGSGVVVAVIDSGVDINHPEFDGGLHPHSQSLTNSSVDDQGGHGTWVAGVLGANRDNAGMHGVAFNSTILALGTDLPGTCASPFGCLYGQMALTAATDIAVSEGAAIINYSLGSFGAMAPDFQTALINAANNGALIVAAAGNEFNNPDPLIAALAINPINPAGLVATVPQLQGPMIAAGAYDPSAGLIDPFIADFSNRAGTAANYYLMAPGVDLLTPNIGGGYTTVSGTSFAAPIIAGAAALLKERFPFMTATQIVDILLVSATDLGAAGTDAIYGRGLLNMANASLPLGTMSIPSTASADGGGADPIDTVLMLGPAFGDVLSGSSVLARAIFLDGYGRDFAIDLTASVSTPSAGPDLLGYLSGGSDIDRFETAFSPSTRVHIQRSGADEQPSSWLGAPLDEEPADASFSIRHRLAEDTDLTIAQGQGAAGQFGLYGAGAPVGGGMLGATDMTFIGMADSGGNATLSTELGGALRFRIGLGVNEAALGREIEGSADDASVYVAEMMHTGESGMRLGMQFGRLHEDGSLLEAGGDGGFSMNGSATTDFVSAFGVVPLTDHIDLFGSYTNGHSDAGSLATDIIGDFDDVRSESMSLGIAGRDIWSTQDRLAFTLARPLRVTSGTATATVPVSRTLDGAVIFEQETVGLTPSGQETDAELSYGFTLGPQESVDFSFVTRFEPDHVQDAAPEFSAGLRYRLTF